MKNNKGFSLVELIIVIAIMAILIGVLAPQYIKYVEKSRVSADEDCADALLNAAMTACTDDEYVYGINGGSTIVFKYGAGVSCPNASLSKALDEYFAKWKDCKVKSKKYKPASYTVTITESSSILKATGSWKGAAN